MLKQQMLSFFSIITCFAATASYAVMPDYTHLFHNKVACFMLYDVNKKKLVTEYNPTRCQERISPDSTFKIPLSLMAFDQQLINQQTVFTWDGKDKGYPFWNQNQTPQTWFKNSAVWVSQELTPKLGLDNIKDYLEIFHYGNQDFYGDPGKHNGLTQAWLSSSLQISATEQLAFMKRLLLDKLEVSKAAMHDTRDNMYLETSSNGWKLYGKTGTGTVHAANQLVDEGWFVGYVEKGQQQYIVITNFKDLKKVAANEESSGPRAKGIAKTLLTNLGVF